MDSGCHLSISMGFYGLLSHFRYSSISISKPLEACLCYLVGGGLDVMVGSLSRRKGFTYHDLQVYKGKREHFVHWNLQEPDGYFRRRLSSQHPYGTLCRYPIPWRRVGTCSCLVGRGVVLFNVQSFCQHCHENDLETIRMVMGKCMSMQMQLLFDFTNESDRWQGLSKKIGRDRCQQRWQGMLCLPISGAK